MGKKRRQVKKFIEFREEDVYQLTPSEIQMFQNPEKYAIRLDSLEGQAILREASATNNSRTEFKRRGGWPYIEPEDLPINVSVSREMRVIHEDGKEIIETIESENDPTVLPRLMRKYLADQEEREQRSIRPLLFMAAFISPRDQREAVVGDLTERFPKDCKQWGATRAKVLLARDILASLGPMAGNVARKAFSGTLKLLGIKAVYKIFFG